MVIVEAGGLDNGVEVISWTVVVVVVVFDCFSDRARLFCFHTLLYFPEIGLLFYCTAC